MVVLLKDKFVNYLLYNEVLNLPPLLTVASSHWFCAGKVLNREVADKEGSVTLGFVLFSESGVRKDIWCHVGPSSNYAGHQSRHHEANKIGRQPGRPSCIWPLSLPQRCVLVCMPVYVWVNILTLSPPMGR